MSRKLKFKPKIARIKLNPEQAVLTCSCYVGYLAADTGVTTGYGMVQDNLGAYCAGGTKMLYDVFDSGTGRVQTWTSGVPASS